MHYFQYISVTFGKLFPINISHKQSINTRSSTEAELVAADDAMGLIFWTKHFLAGQGYTPRQQECYAVRVKWSQEHREAFTSYSHKIFL